MSEKQYGGIAYRPLDKLEEKGALLGKVGFKPTEAAFVFFAFAVVFLIIGHLFGIIMAVLCAAAGLFMHLRIKDHPVMDVYDDGLIFYNPTDISQGIRFGKEEVRYWSVNKDGNYQIVLNLNDNNIHVAGTYQVGKATRLLKKLMSEKAASKVLTKHGR